MPTIGFWLKDLNQYLQDFRRKPRKTPKVDKRDWKSNKAPFVYQFSAQNRSVIGGAVKARLSIVYLQLKLDEIQNDYLTETLSIL